MFEKLNDSGLIAKLIVREEEGFQQLLKATKTDCTRLFVKLNVCDPEELLGRVLLRLVQYDYGKFDSKRGCFSALIATIAWRVFFDWTREVEGRSEVQLGLCLDLLVPPRIRRQSEFVPSPELEALINELPEFERCLLCRRGVDQVGFDQLADECGLSIAAVKGRFYRACKKLRDPTKR